MDGLKPKFDRDDAMGVAYALVTVLKPFCHRIEVAGSLRRGKAQVGDVELVYVPKLAGDLLGVPDEDLAAAKINELVESGLIAKRLSRTGVAAWGPQNKLAVDDETGIPVDFFATIEENWFVALVIRTGSKETNLRLTTGAQALGRKLHAYGCGVERDGQVLRCSSEREVFELCGVPYLEPSER